MTEKLTVALPDHSYDIFMGQSLLNDFERYIPKTLQEPRRFVICDPNTKGYAHNISGMTDPYVIPRGEGAKSFEVYQQTLSWLLDHKISRNDVVIAVGGGVVGDLAGFVAASILRGVPVIQVPTTLLAMVDSSVGGKTGINAPQGKNLIGAFHQPSAVICDFDVLETLPEREMKAGYAEILKYALLGDSVFFDWLEENGAKVLARDIEALKHAVKRSCEMKAQIVIADEKELNGQRALLNLGHTFAHAFEAVMGYDGRLLHGEAVAVGMICAMELSARMSLMNAQQIERVMQHMVSLDLKTSVRDIGLPVETATDDLLNLMRGDKKSVQGRIRFILMKEIGRAFMSEEVDEALVKSILEEV